MQYVADNVDHNIRTLDGSGTFHGMGIITAITPKIDHVSGNQTYQCVCRGHCKGWEDTYTSIHSRE